MKKFLVLGLVLVLGFWGVAFASLTSNVSPCVVAVTSASTGYKNISFEYATRNITIKNDDPYDAIAVDLTSASNTGDLGRCIIISAGDSVDLYDFITNGVSIFVDSRWKGSGNTIASPITVIPTF